MFQTFNTLRSLQVVQVQAVVVPEHEDEDGGVVPGHDLPADESQGVLEVNIPDYWLIGLLLDNLDSVKVLSTPQFKGRICESVASYNMSGITGQGVDLTKFHRAREEPAEKVPLVFNEYFGNTRISGTSGPVNSSSCRGLARYARKTHSLK